MSDLELEVLIEDIRRENYYARHSPTAHIRAALCAKRQGCMAAPMVRTCLSCDGHLECRMRKSAKPVFYELFSSGQRGTTFVKVCATCDITYTISGYEKTSEMGQAVGIKHHYPPELNHPFWFESSRDTIVDLRILHMVDGLLQLTQSGFSPAARLQNYMARVKPGAWQPFSAACVLLGPGVIDVRWRGVHLVLQVSSRTLQLCFVLFVLAVVWPCCLAWLVFVLPCLQHSAAFCSSMCCSFVTAVRDAGASCAAGMDRCGLDERRLEEAVMRHWVRGEAQRDSGHAHIFNQKYQLDVQLEQVCC